MKKFVVLVHLNLEVEAESAEEAKAQVFKKREYFYEEIALVEVVEEKEGG